MATPMTEHWLSDPVFKQALMNNRPIGRPAQREEMSGMVLLLCSPAASFVTGQVYLVDGGQTAH
ncbi:SDR family oxidoreductase [Pseudomonas sp. A34-9]|uniref:SDR family oxidoreductase n=1 Tax=Pseudomonas sp. A34-9 TaxID=3034675 RepID=UPI00240DF600|nr:SDR family oxidoreductase [Pseudomonas sp. A34-9]